MFVAMLIFVSKNCSYDALLVSDHAFMGKSSFTLSGYNL